MSKVSPKSKMSSADYNQSATNHKKRKSTKVNFSTHKRIRSSHDLAIDSSPTSLEKKIHVSKLPFSTCFWALPAELRNQIDEEVFRLKFTRNHASPVPTDPDSDFIKDLETFQNLPEYRRIFASFCDTNTLSIIPHPVPGFLTHPILAPYIKHLAIPRLQYAQYTFPLAVKNSLTGLKSISYSTEISVPSSTDPTSPIFNNRARPRLLISRADRDIRIPLLFYQEILVKRPEVEVIVLAYYQYITVNGRKAPRKSNIAVKYRLLDRDGFALEQLEDVKAGDALWERGMPGYPAEEKYFSVAPQKERNARQRERNARQREGNARQTRRRL